MNITVAVGLITAGSTLAGGLIASITSLKSQGKQLREQNAQLKAERLERHDAERRSIRRKAYMEFLNQLDKMDNLIDIWWPETTLIKYDIVKAEGNISDVTMAFGVLENLMNIVSLEGPEAVEVAAKNATTVIKDSFVGLVVERRKAEVGTVALDEEKQYQCNTARSKAKSAFIEAASKVLE